jgi:hypothetical protein
VVNRKLPLLHTLGASVVSVESNLLNKQEEEKRKNAYYKARRFYG